MFILGVIGKFIAEIVIDKGISAGWKWAKKRFKKNGKPQ